MLARKSMTLQGWKRHATGVNPRFCFRATSNGPPGVAPARQINLLSFFPHRVARQLGRFPKLSQMSTRGTSQL